MKAPFEDDEVGKLTSNMDQSRLLVQRQSQLLDRENIDEKMDSFSQGLYLISRAFPMQTHY
jgi:hypothetical protein